MDRERARGAQSKPALRPGGLWVNVRRAETLTHFTLNSVLGRCTENPDIFPGKLNPFRNVPWNLENIGFIRD